MTPHRSPVGGPAREKVAEAIYRALSGGISPRAWKTEAPWDTNPFELNEWERDEYRQAADAALASLAAKEPA